MTRQNSKLTNIKRAVQFIETALAEDKAPSVKDIAQAAGLSHFHFHRIYKLLTGETCAQTITRLRLARGTSALLQDNISITEAAMTAGYGSSQAFAKVIKRELQTNASDMRTDPERLAKTIQTLIKPNDSISDQTAPALRIEVGSLEPLEILVVRTENIYPDLVDTYNNLFEIAGGPDNVRAVFGLPHEDIELFDDGDFTFDAGLLPQTPVPLSTMNVSTQLIRSGHYLIARHKGLDADLPNTLNALYSTIIRSSNIDFADAPCLHHYIDDPEEIEEALCRTDIYVPIVMRADA